MRTIKFLLTILFSIAVAACGSGGGSSSSSPASANTTIGGSVVKGLMNGAAITVVAVNPNGSDGAQLATATTDASGNWAASAVSATVNRIKVTGGAYVNEADTTSTVSNTTTYTALVDLSSSAVSAKQNSLSVTPVTTFVDARAANLMAAGTPAATSVTQATTLVKSHFGLSSDPLTTTVNLNDATKVASNPDGTKLGLILGALMQQAKIQGNTGTDPGTLIAALSQDFSDGIFDGKKGSTPITYGPSSTPLAVGAGSTVIMSSLSAYVSMASGTTASTGANPFTVTNTSGVAATITNSIANSPATSAQVRGQANVSTSAAAAIYNQTVYLAGKDVSKGLVIYDPGQAVSTTNPKILLLQDPALAAGTCSATNTSSCYKVDGVAVFNNKNLLALYSYNSPSILFVDLTTNSPAVTNPTFNTQIPTQASFSGGSAYVAGAIADNGRNGIWLTAFDGDYFLDMSTSTYTLTNKFVLALTGYGYVSENFGANVADMTLAGKAGYLWAPNYTTYDFMDIGSGTLYQADAATSTAIGVSSPDHGAVDTLLNVGIVAPESGNVVGLVDLTKATFNSTAKQWSIPSANLATAINQWTISEVGSLSAVAVESSSHIALFAYQWGSDIVIAKLDSTNPTKISDYVAFSMTPLGGYSGGDPHAMAVSVNANGIVKGFVVDTSGKTYVLNMTNLLDPSKYARVSATDHTLIGALVTTAATNGDIKSITY
jgi:hypothetical protein